jgi:hypothetical protein
MGPFSHADGTPSTVRGVDLAALEAVELEDAGGDRHRLGDYWAQRPVILVFLRHFG